MDVDLKILEVAVRAAKEAGRYALAHMGKLKEIEEKTSMNDLVTDVDKHCEKTIIGIILKEFPEHSIIAEESGKTINEEEYHWVIDPLDGTTNYAHTLPIFCTSIGVMRGPKVIAGAIYDPSRDELFTASDGKGAFLNGKRISVSASTKVNSSLLVTGFAYDIDGRLLALPYFTEMLRHARAVRRLGSAALDLSYVASGRFDGFWEFGLNPWDMAAGQLLVKEAGGIVTDMEGEELNIFKKNIIASNSSIHSELLSLLSIKPL
ncbi:MAG: inositol monophosphatase [Candidatus Omnitrophica bacterium]|nr:inositol monophosphatase [Candidatus Omnitrophota bacterium]